MKIMVFLQGTAIMHRSALGQPREVRVRQVLDRDESVHDFESYVPVGNVVAKLQAWMDQGAEIAYLSSHQYAEGVETDKLVLVRHGFPAGQVLYRQQGNSYQDVAETALPDVLIEDDCESIGGQNEMTYPHLRPEIRFRVKSIVVKEFGGLDHLPDELQALLNWPV